LPREAVAVPSLAVFKARLDGAPSNLVWWKMSLLMAGGLELGDLQGPFQPKPFYESMTPCHIIWMSFGIILQQCVCVLLSPFLLLPSTPSCILWVW